MNYKELAQKINSDMLNELVSNGFGLELKSAYVKPFGKMVQFVMPTGLVDQPHNKYAVVFNIFEGGRFEVYNLVYILPEEQPFILDWLLNHAEDWFKDIQQDNNVINLNERR